jgi:Flp pilus assembly pilin Flp
MRRLLKTEEGQAAIEYAMLAVLISIVAIVFITGIGVKTAGLFQEFLEALP